MNGFNWVLIMGKTRPQKKVKNELVFDNKEREDFLKGFSKRKLQRKKAAKEESERKLKIEVKRIRDEVSFDVRVDHSLY